MTERAQKREKIIAPDTLDAKISPKREKLIQPQETDEDIILNMSLRPKKLLEFVGQKEVVDNLMVALAAAKKRKEPLEHILLSGPPGLGKTALAYIVANEMDAKITATSGPAIERAGDLIGILTNLSEGDILFIDEIHRLSRTVEEFLYPAMENYEIDFVVDKGPYAKTIKFSLKRFTLIGATTRSGLLTVPLRSRFGMFFHLDFYKPEDLAKIISRSAKILGISVDKEGCLEIAGRSRGTPRFANRLLRRVRDWAEVKRDGKIDKKVADEALSAHGVDKMGLDPIDRKVIKTLVEYYRGGPVGLDALAATLNEEQDTIVDVVEPYLLKIGYLKRTPQGRKLTQAAMKYYGEANKEPAGELFKQ